MIVIREMAITVRGNVSASRVKLYPFALCRLDQKRRGVRAHERVSVPVVVADGFAPAAEEAPVHTSDH